MKSITEIFFIKILFTVFSINTIRQHPVTWQPSKDGDRLIGRILLNKRLKDGSVPRDSGAMLGLKVGDEYFEANKPLS